MTHTTLGPGILWGLAQATAPDELCLLTVLTSANPVLDQARREYELRLMAHVVPAQRWGVPAGAGPGVTVHVKNLSWADLVRNRMTAQGLSNSFVEVGVGRRRRERCGPALTAQG